MAKGGAENESRLSPMSGGTTDSSKDPSENKCRFFWRIIQPFVPMRRFDAIFYHGSGTPFLTEWKVILDPILPQKEFEYMAFRLTIQLLQPERSVDIIAVERIKVKIYLHTFHLNTGEFEMPGYVFRKENHHSFVRELRVKNSPSDYIRLILGIDLYFPDQAVEPPRTDELVFHDRDLWSLSRDLERLQRCRRYSDLILKSTDKDHPVHSFMLRARWNNFFTEHPEHSIIDHQVRTGISEKILTCILDYIYWGKGRRTYDWKDHEFCEVIDRYRLHHFYMNFALDDEGTQMRKTVQEGPSFQKEYQLEYKTDNLKYLWIPAENRPEYDIRLNIWFHVSRDDPKFSYTMESRSPLRLFARLTLEMIESRIRRRRARIERTFHFQDFVFEPNETKQNGGIGKRIAFEGDRVVLHHYMKSWCKEPEQRDLKFSFRFILTLGTGTKTTQLGPKLPVCSNRFYTERCIVLSNHMSELMNQEDDYDFQVSCPGEGGRDKHRLHKAIFAARVPKYWAVLSGVEKGNEIPDEASCLLRSEAFRYVRQYIYTGKVFRIPEQLLDEIGNFAKKGGIRFLEKLVDQIRRKLKNR